MKVEWHGNTRCDFCGKECQHDLYDGKTIWGSWAVMCKTCFRKNGEGLGKGRGQRYRKQEDDAFVKCEG